MRAGGAPLIFAAWAREMTRAVFADEMGGGAVYFRQVGRAIFDAASKACWNARTRGGATTRRPRWRNLRAGAARWIGPGRTLQPRADMARWQWGALHRARAEHRPFSRVQPLAPWFELRVATGGDNYTVNVARYHLKGDEPYLNEHAASLRRSRPGNPATRRDAFERPVRPVPPDRLVDPGSVRDLPCGAGERN